MQMTKLLHARLLIKCNKFGKENYIILNTNTTHRRFLDALVRQSHIKYKFYIQYIILI